MATKFYNTPPYYDDFDPAKNYVRVLFRPGYAVQARELTQLQTAISAQIDRFGSHVFKDGSPVLGGQATLDVRYAFVKLESTFTDSGTTYYPEGGSGQTAYYSNSVGRTLTGAVSGITATVLEVVQSDSTDPLTAFVRYTAASSDNLSHFFTAEEILNYTESTGTARKFKVKPSNVTPTGYGTRVSVNDGVYFVAGNFVYTPVDSVIISKYTQNPSARIVYKVTESIVTSAEDATLVDNSLGTPNESAPGAHRYQVAMDLMVQPYSLAARTEDNIIQILLVVGGQVTGRARVEYAELAKELAIRTYEESGNYTVRPFQINVREYYNSGTNNGLFTQAQIQAANPGFTSQQAIDYGTARLAVGLEPSVAYVSGYRIQTLDTTYVPVEKSRDEAFINGASIFCPLGGYIYIDTLVGLPNISTYTPIDLKNSGATTIGTARARALEYVSGSGSSAFYKLYLFDVVMNSGESFSSVTSLSDTTVPGNDFTANCNDIDAGITTTVLYDPANSSLVYKLPASAVQSLRSSDDVTCDFFYYVRRKFDNVAPSGSTIQLTASSESFYSVTQADYIVVNSSGVVQTQASAPTLGTGGSTVTLTLSGAPGSNCYIIAPVRRNLVEKSKTFVSGVTSGTGVGQKVIAVPNTVPGSYDSLSQIDILRIKAVHMSTSLATAATTSDTNIADRYDLDNGQRENFYDIGRIRLKSGASAPIGQLLVVFDHFTHNPGDYFCVNSYPGIDYGLIPAFDSIKGRIELRDAVDFRPTKSAADSTFTGAGASTTNTIVPNSVILTDIQHYLPRIDKIYVNKNGQFGSVKGISSSTPRPPQDPEDSMPLYTISLGAYTFGPTDLAANMVDNKRYTMRDIGRLEKRLSNVEYYTSLSLLEKEAASAQIFDSSNNQRYKNGFIVDSFANHNVGAVSHPDYRCSIDAEKGLLLPDYAQEYINLVPNTLASSGIKQTGSLVTLDYTEVTMIEQPYSSYVEFVNPHAVYRWEGQLTVSPPGDDWIDIETKPDISANASSNLDWYNDASDDQAAQAVFNGWQVNWFGASPEEEEELAELINSGVVPLIRGANTISAQVVGGKTITGNMEFVRGTYSNTATSQISDAVVDTSIVPYIRSRKIYFKATGLKPNSKVYAFFDGVNVANYVRTESSFVDYTTNPDDRIYSGLTSHPSGATTLVTNASGELIGSFVIPNNDTLRFRTGSRIFRLIDNTVNDTNTAFTFADFTYTATGLKETRQSNVVSVEAPRVIPMPTPGPAPVVLPITGISVQGRTPKYINIPFNFDVSAAATGYGTLTSLSVFQRSGATDPSTGTWSQALISYQSGTTSGGYSANAVFRISPTMVGVYQVQARAVWNGVTYTSNTVTFTLSATPAELVGQPIDDRFYN